MTEPNTPLDTSDPTPRHGWLPGAAPYVAPLLAMLACTALADALPQWRAHLYILKIVLVSALLWRYRRQYAEITRSPGGPMAVAAVAGFALIVLWIAADHYYPQSMAEWQQLGQGGWQAFPHGDKVTAQLNPLAPGLGLPPLLFIAFRVLGAVLMVPLAEELFYRAWLLRFLIREDFRGVPLGTFTWQSFLISTAIFGLSHHEWLAGLICGALFNGLLYWRRNLTLCIVAHAAANLGLAAWVLAQGAWQFW